MSVWGIVVAGGAGARFGGSKQFLELRGRRLVDRAVSAASLACDAIVVVLPGGTVWDGPAVDRTVEGGPTRAASVRAGLGAVPDDAEVVVVHDAARPLASSELFDAVIEAVRAGADAAVPAIAVSDTIKRIDGPRVVETVSRDQLVAVQTPQGFKAGALRAAHSDDPEATDDAALVERRGGTVVVVAGDPRNRKVTTPEDLSVLSHLEDHA